MIGWKLLRTKTDPTVDDTDWVGTVSTAGLAAASDPASPNANNDRSFTGVIVVAVPITSAGNRTQIARGAGTIDMTLVIQVNRNVPAGGGADGVAAALTDTVTEAAVPLCRQVYFPINGAQSFTLRVTNDVAYPGGSAALEIWFREVSV